MRTLNPKQFIQQVFINEIGMLITNHPYISFMIMGIGLEFLGKCLSDEDQDWNTKGKSRKSFERAIKQLDSLRNYIPLLKGSGEYDLYDSLRCGLLHSAVPKHQITLSSKGEMEHLRIFNDRINLRCEDFYEDFKAASNEIIEKVFPTEDKMNRGLLIVPSYDLDRVLDDTDDAITGSQLARP